MKKSILMLVLASLALPSMAILNVDQKAKMKSALAIIHSNGLNPTILADTLQIDWTQDKYQFVDNATTAQTLQDAISSTGDFVLYQGDHEFGTIAAKTGPEAYGMLEGISHYSDGSGGAFRAFDNYFTDPNYQDLFLHSGGSYQSSYKSAYNAWSSNIIFTENRNGSKAVIREEDHLLGNYIASDVSVAIINNAENLKGGIKEMGLYVAAAELGKSANDLCDNGGNSASTNIACLSFGKKFVSISSKIAGPVNNHYLYNGQEYYLNPANNRYSTMTSDGRFNGGSSESWMINQGATWVESSSVAIANDYQNSIDTIFDVADSFIEIDGILNSTEGGVSYGDILR